LEDFGDLLNTIPVLVEDMDFGVGLNSGDQALIVFYLGVDDQELIVLTTLVVKTRVILRDHLDGGSWHSFPLRG